MEAEWYYLADRGEVMVNVTDLYGEDFSKVLTDIEQEFLCTGGVEHFTDTTESEPQQWMFLLGATKRSML